MQTKIKILILNLFLIPIGNTAFSQEMINAGSDIYVSPGTKMVVNSDYKNLNDGQIDNNGNIDIYGNWTNEGTTTSIHTGGTGITTFKGSVQQTIGGNSNSLFNSLHLANNVGLSADIEVEDELYLFSGSLFLNDYNLNVGYGQSYSSNSFWYHVVTNGSGLYQAIVPQDSSRRFIIGYDDFYLDEVFILNHASGDLFSVNLKSGILSQGTSGSTIPEIDDCVPLSWEVTPSNIANANYQLKLGWEELQEGNTFNRYQAAVGYYQNGQWNANTESYSSGGDPWYHRLDSITFGGVFAVGDLESPMAIVMEMNIDLTAFLEGSYNGNDMNIRLNSAGLIPLSQPFNTAPWNYEGTESVTSIPANVVDWVLIEGRDSPTAQQASETQTFGRQAGFLLSDGSIVGMDGVSPISFLHYHLMYELFVIVHHRNHLSILSSNYLTKVNGVYSYDFSTSTAQAYQSGEKDVNGIAVMYGGDANADGVVNTDDGTVWQGEAGTSAYLKSDINLDGQSDNKDKNDILFFNIGAESKVPQ